MGCCSSPTARRGASDASGSRRRQSSSTETRGRTPWLPTYRNTISHRGLVTRTETHKTEPAGFEKPQLQSFIPTPAAAANNAGSFCERYRA